MEQGLVAKYTVDGTSSACFEYLGHDEHCHKHVCFHCKCEKCGKVIHLECEEMTHLGKHMLDDHGFQGTDGSSVAEGKFCDFSFLPEMPVDSMLFNRDVEHLACRCTVDVFSFFEYFCAPCFTGEVGENSGFNGRVVADDEFIAGTGNEGGADQLGQGIRDVIIEQIHHVIAAGPHQLTGFCKIFHVVLREVLQLDQSARPANS